MAAIGQSTGGDAATQGDQGQQAQTQQGPDLSSLAGHLDSLAAGQQDLREMLSSWQQQGQGEGSGDGQQQQAPPEIDLSFIDTGDPALDQQLATQLAERINQHIGAREQGLMQQIEQRFGAFDERISERERMEHAQNLVGEFNELGDPNVAQEVVQTATQYAEACGWPTEVASDPRFWRLTYMAGRAADAANGEQQEGSGDPGAAHLEGGGGANPGAGGQVDPADAWIKNALSDGMGHRALPWH